MVCTALANFGPLTVASAAVQGLKKEYDYKKILKALKKGIAHHLTALHRQDMWTSVPTLVAPAADFCCNGTVVEDDELGQVIQLQGDQRKNVAQFLLEVIVASFPLVPSVELTFLRLRARAARHREEDPYQGSRFLNRSDLWIGCTSIWTQFCAQLLC